MVAFFAASANVGILAVFVADYLEAHLIWVRSGQLWTGRLLINQWQGEGTALYLSLPLCVCFDKHFYLLPFHFIITAKKHTRNVSGEWAEVGRASLRPLESSTEAANSGELGDGSGTWRDAARRDETQRNYTQLWTRTRSYWGQLGAVHLCKLL